MPSHFSAIGFSTESHAEFAELVQQAAHQGREYAVPDGYYVEWSPGGGIQVWVKADPGRQLVGMDPHFSGRGRLRLGVLEARRSADYPLDGSLYGWVNPPDDDPSTGEYPVLIDVPDAAMAGDRITVPAVVTLQVAAFAHELACFADDHAYLGAQADGIRLAPESVIPSGLFSAGDDPEVDDRRAEAIAAGHIERVERLLNPVSGRPFVSLLVRTLGGTLDVVADPETVAGEPIVGGVVRGSFWLSGRLVDDRVDEGRPRGASEPGVPDS
jgi:hypothetical protein